MSRVWSCMIAAMLLGTMAEWSVTRGEESIPHDTVTMISFLLDETGSMESIKDDTIGGFNSYLDALQHPDAGMVEFTLIKFDSTKIEKVYVGVPINEVRPLTPETYRPGAMTPLIDATVKLINATEDALQKRTDTPKVLVIIQTDGQENASREYTMADLQDAMKAKTAAGWQFVFLGAGIDAFTQAAAMGIPTSTTLSYARETSAATFQALSVNTTSYRRSSNPADLVFSVDQRAATGGEQPPPPAVMGGSMAGQPQTGAAVPLPQPVTPIIEDFTLAPEAQQRGALGR